MLKISIATAAIVLACAATGASAQGAPQIATALVAAVPAQWQPGPGWDRDIDVRCASSGYNYNMCQVDTGRGSDVRLVR